MGDEEVVLGKDEAISEVAMVKVKVRVNGEVVPTTEEPADTEAVAAEVSEGDSAVVTTPVALGNLDTIPVTKAGNREKVVVTRSQRNSINSFNNSNSSNRRNNRRVKV